MIVLLHSEDNKNDPFTKNVNESEHQKHYRYMKDVDQIVLSK